MSTINPNGGVSAPTGPVAVGGRPQAVSGPKIPVPRAPAAKVVKVKAHTRVVQPKVTQPAAPYAAAVQSAVDAKFGPQIQAAQQGIVNQQYGQMRASHWFQDYQNMLQAQQQATAQQAQALAHALGAYSPAAAQTGNPQADALAQQAALSQQHMGQAFAGTQSQLSQNLANQFATGLIPGASLANQAYQQNATNQIGQLQQQLGTLKSNANVYGQGVRSQLAQQDYKNSIAKQRNDIAAKALGIRTKTLNNVQIPLAKSLINNRVQGQRLGRAKLQQTKNQNAVNNALKVNNLALKSYLAAHPELKQRGGGGFSPTQVRKSAANFRRMSAMLDENAVVSNPQGAVDALVKGKAKADPVVANAVVESIVNNGSVSRATATAYFRATGQHLHVSPTAHPISGSKNLGQIVAGVLQKLGK